jgi:hypothetical protein
MLIALEGRVRQLAELIPEQEASPGGRDQEGGKQGALTSIVDIKSHASAAVETVGGVLLRRWKRHLGEDKDWSLQQLGQWMAAVADAKNQVEQLRAQRRQHFDDVRGRFEEEQRRVHVQSQILLRASTAVNEEKRRKVQAVTATREERQNICAVSLCNVRRVKEELEGLALVPELKQKHSVLLYSLRVLEGQLKKDVPASDQDDPEGAVEESEEQRRILQEADADFENALAVELGAFEASTRQQSESLVLQLAKRLRSEIMVEHGSTLIVSQAASWEIAWEASQVEFIPRMLESFAWATAKLAEGAEAAGSGDAGRPACDSALRFVLGVRGLMDLFLGPDPKGFDAIILAAKASTQAADAEWEAALATAEQAWQAFCSVHPALSDEAAALDEDGGASPQPIVRSVFSNREFPQSPTEPLRPRTSPQLTPSTNDKASSSPLAAGRKKLAVGSKTGPKASGNKVRPATTAAGERSPKEVSVSHVSSVNSQLNRSSSTVSKPSTPSSVTKGQPRALAFAGGSIVGPATSAKAGGRATPAPLQSLEGHDQRSASKN